MSSQKLWMIGHAHLDPVWLWQWQEGFQETKATFRSALDRMEEYPEFKFISSSAAFYEWVEKSDPKMFQEIKKRVDEGRWELVGGWWVEPDCNIPSGESFVRQALYGQHYFLQKFGKKATVGFNADSFGHNAMLPQILKRSGLDYYVFMRPMPNEKGLPGRLFWWEADDGSRVLAYRIPYEYLTWGKDVDTHVTRCAALLKPPYNDLMCFYGVGNHGGGPTKENLDSIRTWNEKGKKPQLECSTIEEFFHYIEQENLNVPVVHDDLQHHASGCYAAHSGVKMWNRRAENLLVVAEKLATIASWQGKQNYPSNFDQAWKDVLFNQFHDILAGTSLESAYEDARQMYGEAMTIGSRNLNYALQALSWNINIEPEERMRPIVVFNPHSWESKVNVELEMGGSPKDMALFDDKDREVPLQIVQSQATANGRYRLSFMANLPSLGYRVFKLRPAQKKQELSNPIHATDTVMENDKLRIEFDSNTGFIQSLVDKEFDFNLLKGAGARPVVIEDKSDTWSHNVLQFAKEVGTFAPKSVARVEHGPVKSVIRVVSQFGSSTLTQDFTMYKDSRQIDVHVTVDWREQFKMLKLKFPVNLIFRKATYEIPYGHIERPVNGEEEPGQSWVDLSGIIEGKNEVYGVSILNDGKYSFDIHNNEIGLTVLRSPIHAHHDPLVPDEEGFYSFIDQGIQRFTYSLLPHKGSWEKGQTIKRALELNQRPIALLETYHSGDLPLCESFVSVDQENIVVSVIKKAEDNDDMIIRCFETAKEATKAQISLPKWDRIITANFGPCEIKTFRVPKRCDQPIEEVNLLEERV